MQKYYVALKQKAQILHFGFGGICLCVCFKAAGRIKQNFSYCYIRNSGSAAVLQEQIHGGAASTRKQIH